MFDIRGVPLAIGQWVVFMPVTFWNGGPLHLGIIAALSPSISIRCGSQRFALPAHLSKRVCVLREDTEAEAWLRRRLIEIDQ